jgi:alpha-1,3-mannosyltransferase
MSLRVAHVVRQYHPSVGGMEEVVRQIVRHQLEAGQRPQVVTLDRLFHQGGDHLAPSEEVEGVPVHRLPYAGSTRYPLCPQVLGELHETDLVHVHGVDFFFDYLAATRWLHHRPMVASTHGGFFHTAFAARAKRVYFNTVTRASARAYARLVATSDNDGQLFGPIVDGERLTVIENGVDVAKFRDRAARAPLPTLIFFGRWACNKGLAETLDLLARLREKEPSWRLILAGREYDHDAAELRAWAAERGLAGSVEVVPNPTDAELADVMGQASYFVSLSRHEGFGLAAVEAFSAGLQPVLADIPPYRRLVERSGLGLLVGRGDTALENAAAALLAGYRAGLASEARRRRAMAFAAAYDWRRVAGRYLALYAEVEAQACA